MRGVAVAQKNREREIAVETERVEKARQLEVIGREREVSLVGISRDKEVELQKKEIADVVRARIAVDKTVAVEEENIKDVRTIADANREREQMKIKADAEASTTMVKQVKAAEASEEVAKHAARQKTITADAELDTADKLARAKIRLAEGVQAEAAAEGLAKARVKEADAVATEKLGLVEARVSLEKMQSVAAGEEKHGLAKARVKEADADAIQKLGMAEAATMSAKLSAEATGEEQKGLAGVKVREADTQVLEKRGVAEASNVREKLLAEAAGIAEKAVSMKALDEASREHEEFRLRLDKEKTIELETIHAKRDMAAALGADPRAGVREREVQHRRRRRRVLRSLREGRVSVGQSIDGVVDSSDNVKSLVQSAMRPDDEAVLGLVEKLLVNDPAAQARLAVVPRVPSGAGE